jgi:hypothetical protein
MLSSDTLPTVTPSQQRRSVSMQGICVPTPLFQHFEPGMHSHTHLLSLKKRVERYGGERTVHRKVVYYTFPSKRSITHAYTHRVRHLRHAFPAKFGSLPGAVDKFADLYQELHNAQFRTALCMGSHPRLGQHSLLITLQDDVLQTICSRLCASAAGEENCQASKRTLGLLQNKPEFAADETINHMHKVTAFECSPSHDLQLHLSRVAVSPAVSCRRDRPDCPCRECHRQQRCRGDRRRALRRGE